MHDHLPKPKHPKSIPSFLTRDRAGSGLNQTAIGQRVERNHQGPRIRRPQPIADGLGIRTRFRRAEQVTWRRDNLKCADSGNPNWKQRCRGPRIERNQANSVRDRLLEQRTIWRITRSRQRGHGNHAGQHHKTRDQAQLHVRTLPAHDENCRLKIIGLEPVNCSQRTCA
jgi:hypothetical protein